MFGSDQNLARLVKVLDRQVPINSLVALCSAVDRKAKITPNLESTAIGIDSSVFLKLALHKHSADIVDYLDTEHMAPLILPGQAIQEFWNNQLAAVDTVASGIKKKFEALKQEANKSNLTFGEFTEKMESLLGYFSSEYGYVYDPATLRATTVLLDLLRKKAFLSYIPRAHFQDIALVRKRTKTPPGFKDDGDGDFFIWAEFLFGLLSEKDSGKHFDHAIILTHDQKIDWSRAGVAHPILVAEVQALIGMPFDVWTIEQFYQAIAENSSEKPIT